ncbi:hypothetical protein NP233_g9001 [Leucocoprinus birnbaumii]|uniref:GDP-mannose transporter n=1 Tax=Leucocoprinus birnbaumii TaxID=56174 RepID=A0AAD5YMM0_9AGAR|nr:hypothetical protein NP233_g9001 [Leucocoprinus birnbaumii]
MLSHAILHFSLSSPRRWASDAHFLRSFSPLVFDMAQQNPQKPASRGMVTGVVVFYLVAALAMVLVNKWVLNKTDAPLFFLWVQLVIAVVMFLVSDLFRLLPDRLSFDLSTCKGLVAMQPPLFSSTLAPSLLILLACTVVTIGFFIGVLLDGEPVSMKGISYGVASSAITAIHSVVIKQSLSVVNGSALLLSWYTNLLSAIVLMPIIYCAQEGPAILKLLFGLDELLRPEQSEGLSPLQTFIWGSIITGIFGFLMSIASLLSIKVTSPITHMVSSAVRSVLASLLAMWYLHEVITTGRASSIAIILLGSVWYTWIKHQESLPPAGGSPQGSYERVRMEELESGDSQKERKPE